MNAFALKYDEARVRRDPAYARCAVFARDLGVCSSCGTDTEEIRIGYRSARSIAMGEHGARMARINRMEPAASALLGTASGLKLRGELKAIDDRLRELGFVPGEPMWNAHHETAVKEGGGGCGLDGYASACTPCHRTLTTELRARLRRKPTKAWRPRMLDRRGRA